MITSDRNNHQQCGNGEARGPRPELSADVGPGQSPGELSPGSMGDSPGQSIGWELQGTQCNLEKPMMAGLSLRGDCRSGCVNSKIRGPAVALGVTLIHTVVFYCCCGSFMLYFII